MHQLALSFVAAMSAQAGQMRWWRGVWFVTYLLQRAGGISLAQRAHWLQVGQSSSSVMFSIGFLGHVMKLKQKRNRKSGSKCLINKEKFVYCYKL